MKMPELSEEQAAGLLAKKKTWSEENGKAGDACQNLKCRCVECTCGAACTCNISPEVNCDECATFKKGVVAKNNAARLEGALAFYAEKVAPNYEGIKLIRAAEVQSLIAAASPEVLLVDVRKEEERAVSIIPGSVSGEAFDADPEGLGAGKLIVTYCTIGGRSCGYAKKLLDMPSQPWAEVRNFELSMMEWCHLGLPLVDPSGAPTTRVHPCIPAMMDFFPVMGYEVVPV